MRELLQRALDDQQTPLTGEGRRRLVAEIADDVLGFGPIEPFLRDRGVTEIMVNAPEVIYVEREGRSFPADGRVVDETHLYSTRTGNSCWRWAPSSWSSASSG